MQLHILGSRGIPAAHGGFETFCEHFALYMVSRGHDVTVYCQGGPNEEEQTEFWCGVRRHILAAPDGPSGTVRFDLQSALIASRRKDAILLTLGYNTAVFSLIHRVRGVSGFMNMDGIEWRRQKWSAAQRLWLRANEWCGATFSNHLIADHPEIGRHLAHLVDGSKVTVIPYGADAITEASVEPLQALDLVPGSYYVLIARPEPENSVLEIVQAYKQSARRYPLVILGKYSPESNPYHAQVLAAAGDSTIIFPGAIYERETIRSLRFHATAYLHGHQVGGTNPSLVEAMAAGNAVVAHRNPYTRWVAGPGALFFSDVEELGQHFSGIENHSELLLEMRAASRLRHSSLFRSELILQAYERLLSGQENHQASPWVIDTTL